MACPGDRERWQAVSKQKCEQTIRTHQKRGILLMRALHAEL